MCTSVKRVLADLATSAMANSDEVVRLRLLRVIKDLGSLEL
jgi:hypothetical protein